MGTVAMVAFTIVFQDQLLIRVFNQLGFGRDLGVLHVIGFHIVHRELR
jgi:hypothetical protein